MKADGGGSAPRLPAPQHRVEALPHVGKVREFAIQVSTLPLHKPANVRVRHTPRSLDCDDLPDLVQAEAEPLRLRDASRFSVSRP